MIDKKDKIITLKNGTRYVIVAQCLYDGTPYYFASLLENNETTEEFKILTIYRDGITGKEKVKLITNDNIIKNVCRIMENTI